MAYMARGEKLLEWFARRILPHEPAVRAWLNRTLNSRKDVEDVIQEIYCRLCAIEDVEKISSPRAYLFRTARNVLIDEARRARVVSIETYAEIDSLDIAGLEADPEQITSAREELRRVVELIQSLPPRCRKIFELRKIHGLSQKEISKKLSISENIVENETSRGLRLILKALEDGRGILPAPGAAGGRVRSERAQDNQAGD